MKMIFAILIATLISPTCSSGSGPLVLVYYREGKELQVPRDSFDPATVESTVRALFAGTTDMLRLYVDAERIASLKQTDTVLEVIFDKTTTLQSKEFGEVSVKRVLMPMSGDFVGNAADPVITLFPANDGYLTGPYRNPTGYPELMKLKALVEQSLAR